MLVSDIHFIALTPLIDVNRERSTLSRRRKFKPFIAEVSKLNGTGSIIVHTMFKHLFSDTSLPLNWIPIIALIAYFDA